MHLHVAIPCHGRPWLTRGAVDAIRRTTALPHTFWLVAHGGPGARAGLPDGAADVRTLVIPETWPPGDGSAANGAKLDAVLARPEIDGWLLAMHNDAAPMRPRAVEWLIERVGDGPWGGFGTTPRGNPHSFGALYRVAWLREIGASFAPRRAPGQPFLDVCEAFTGLPPFIARRTPTRPLPWWLRGNDLAFDEAGDVVWAHLGGGTIGSSSWRLPSRYWVWRVRRHLARAAGR